MIINHSKFDPTKIDNNFNDIYFFSQTFFFALTNPCAATSKND